MLPWLKIPPPPPSPPPCKSPAEKFHIEQDIASTCHHSASFSKLSIINTKKENEKVSWSSPSLKPAILGNCFWKCSPRLLHSVWKIYGEQAKYLDWCKCYLLIYRQCQYQRLTLLYLTFFAKLKRSARNFSNNWQFKYYMFIFISLWYWSIVTKVYNIHFFKVKFCNIIFRRLLASWCFARQLQQHLLVSWLC